MDIEQFLQTVSEVGTFESEGSFTLSLERAFNKLAVFGQSNPTYFALRIVQAAVAAGADDVRFQHSRHGISVDFVADFGPIGSILQWISGSEDNLTQAQRHLAAALVAAPSHWVLRLNDSLLAREGAEFRLYSASGQKIGLHWALQAPRVKKRTLQKSLEDDAGYAPIPVYLNGRSTWTSWRGLEGDESLIHGEPSDLAQVVDANVPATGGFTLPSVPLDETDLEEGWHVWKGTRGWMRRGTKFAERRPCWLTKIEGVPAGETRWRLTSATRRAMYTSQQGRARLIVDGVALRSIPLPEQPGVEVLEWACWARTDLSGLRIVEDDNFEAFKQRLTDRARLLGRAVLQFSPRIQSVARGRSVPMSRLSRKYLLESVGASLGALPLAADHYQRPNFPKERYHPLGFLSPARIVPSYLAWDDKDGSLVVVQEIAYEEKFEKTLEQYRKPPTVPGQLKLLNVFTAVDTRWGRKYLYLVSPYLWQPQLSETLRSRDRVQKISALLLVLENLARLEPPAGHGRLTPNRIFHDESAAIVLNDMVSQLRPTPPLVGDVDWPSSDSLEYLSPEEITGSCSDLYSCNIFAFGIILWEFFTGSSPFPPTDNTMETVVRKLHWVPPDLQHSHPHLNTELAKFIQIMVQANPSSRTVDLQRLKTLLEEERQRPGDESVSRNA